MTELTQSNFTAATDPNGEFNVIEMIDISNVTRTFANCTITFERGGFWGNGRTRLFLSNCSIKGNGTISGCRFEAKTEGGVTYNEGINVLNAKRFIFDHCNFVGLSFGLRVVGATYDMDVHSCFFSECQTGICTERDVEHGIPNNNHVRGCHFENCSVNPVNLECINSNTNDVEYANSWHFCDCRFENGNGTSIMGNHTRIDNLRIEKNLAGVPWLVLPSDCEVDIEIHAVSNETETLSTSTWRIIVMGGNNHVRARFVRFNPYGIISYSTQNSWNIINENYVYSTPTAYIFDPDDHFSLNGWDKDTDYVGTNRVIATNVSINTSGTAISVPGGNCYPLSGSSANVTVRIPNEQDVREMYISGTFYPVFTSTTNNQQVKLFHGFRMNPVSKWYRYVAATNHYTGPNSLYPEGDSAKTIYTSRSGIKVYLNDVVYSQEKLLFDRPILETQEANTYNQWKNDGLIHLQSTCVNRIINSFSFKLDGLQHYINPLGKMFYFSSSQNKYYWGDIEIPHSIYVNTGVVPQNSDGGIPHVIRDMLNVNVELYDFNGNHLFLHAQRTNTSQYFTITVKESCGMTYKTSNPVGTIAVNEMVGKVIAWVEKA